MEERAKKIVTVIQANPLLSKQKNENAILKVAAYCRVSTDSEDQIESYKAQVSHYTEAIMKNPKWRFVKVYADEGITGTLDRKRENFLKMIRDCKKGKIDLILTKSFSRFARNTVDSLKYVRQLKALGIGVFFEEQNLNSLTADSEMFVGLYSVMAQAESENISANVRWGIRQRMKSGTYPFRYNILGYKKGANGEPEIVPGEADIIRTIYRFYLDGQSVGQIRKYLQENGIQTKSGKTQWSESTVQSILSNERYCGNVLLQKTYREDCISKKVKRNRGEVDKYLIVNNHIPIISEDVFKRTQREIARRNGLRKTSMKGKTEQGKYSGRFALTELLVCGECGSPYKRITWKRQGENRKVWRCKSRAENGIKYCKDSITLDEQKLHEAICRGLSKATENRQEVFELILSNLSFAVTENENMLDAYAIERELKDIGEHIRDNVKLMNNTQGDKNRYVEIIKNLSDKSVALRKQLELTRDKIAAVPCMSGCIEEIKEMLTNEQMCFKEFDDVMVRRLVEMIRVDKEGQITIFLKGGLSVTERVEK